MNYSSKLILTFPLAMVLASFNCTNAHGQTDSLKTREIKLSKNERIRSLAYDDTTKAFASLFISKREALRGKQKKDLIVFGISTGIFLAGGLMLVASDNPNFKYRPILYVGFPIMFIGGFGMLGAPLSAGLHELMLNPYSIRKYKRLIEIHKSGKPLPEFYLQKLQPYLGSG